MKTQIQTLNASDSFQLKTWFDNAFAPFTFEIIQNGYRLEVDEKIKSNIDFFKYQNTPTNGDEETWLEMVTAQKIERLKRRPDPIEFAFVRASIEIFPSLTEIQ